MLVSFIVFIVWIMICIFFGYLMMRKTKIEKEIEEGVEGERDEFWLNFSWYCICIAAGSYLFVPLLSIIRLMM